MEYIFKDDTELRKVVELWVNNEIEAIKYMEI
jgi:hypothetical protein